ncbi:ATP-binding cassette domain-containing protein [Pseudomonas sp. H9]|uniref:ATP-binding cassette domain-containing protein n=1 Tax=Pseudomonas sp. H9 TaxID=483968 RepID=UPI00105814F2|nr:ATP-binding cassette domain-containing protein [Pseudomonas sp. H9]TDF83794.1 ATP-binding cassette domain-containing protein [Pseudomonas sp. H9]
MNSPFDPRSALSPVQRYWSEDARMQRIADSLGNARLQASPLARSLPTLLVALDWFGAPRLLAPSLPPEGEAFTENDLRALLDDIGFHLVRISSKERERALDQLPSGSLALNGERCSVYLGRHDGLDWWHDGVQPRSDWQPPATDDLLRVQRDLDHSHIDAPQPDWLPRLFGKAHRELAGVLLISLIVNLLALAVSLFTMVVYNTVIPSGATDTLWALACAAGIAVVAGWLLRVGRSVALARLGAWAGANIGPAVLRKTLGLPVEVSGRLGVNNNLNRMRSLESLRQYVGGAGTAALIDYPFVVIFLATIALLGGWIVLVPIAGLLLYLLAAKLLRPIAQRQTSASARAANQLTEAFASGVRRLRALQGVNGSHHWLQRLRDLSVQAAKTNRDLVLTQALTHSVGHALGMLTVLATMAGGIALVIGGGMSTGGLIAAMMLIWRVTGPAQQFFAFSLRLQQLQDARLQLDRLMLSTGELQDPQVTLPVEPLPPRIGAERLFYRHASDREPALNNISFQAEPGQLIAVVGPNGAGKSTLLQCLAGIRCAQSGRVSLDGRDIRQFNPCDYRTWVGFQMQSEDNLPLSIRQSLLLSHPFASQSQIYQTLTRVAGENWWRLLGCESVAQALDLRLDPWRDDPRSLRIRHIVGLTDALLGTPALVLLDDPLRDGDPLLDGSLKQVIGELHGKSTVLIATHRPSLIRMADAILVLDQGNLVHFGPVVRPEECPAAIQEPQS